MNQSRENDTSLHRADASDADTEQTEVTVIERPAAESGATPPAHAETNLRAIKRALFTIVVLFVIGAFYIAQDVLIPIVLALLLSLLLSPIVTGLEKFARLPRALGGLLTVVALVGVMIYAAASLAQPAQNWIAHAPQTMSRIQQRLRSLREPIRKAQEASKKIEELTQPTSPTTATTVVRQESGLLADMATSMPRALGSIAAVLLLVYFFLSSGNGFLRRLVEVAPGLHEKRLVVSIAREVQQEMSRYLVMVSLINFGLGLALAATLVLLGVPNPLLWGAVAMVLNFAPYVGPACVIFALALVGFTTFDSLGQALAVPSAFFGLTVLEGQLLTPMIIGHRLSLNPTVVFVWLLLWGWLWGIPGILLAGPLLACFRIVCQHVRVLHPIFIMIGDD
ncbi:MAG TPA: AI-2E family transporter [Rudaea sp.]|nr:AI-2E family transporter [Rudaea sp.]